ncbi:unnamed protein product [Closterium sp. Yama58-4]|nr:unnamed protein product [Closterium sp. Yama58-4]
MAASSYWRAAGMTYLAYANQCAAHLRACLKEPLKSQAIAREQVYYKVVQWKEGVPDKPVIRQVSEAVKSSSA